MESCELLIHRRANTFPIVLQCHWMHWDPKQRIPLYVSLVQNSLQISWIFESVLCTFRALSVTLSVTHVLCHIRRLVSQVSKMSVVEILWYHMHSIQIHFTHFLKHKMFCIQKPFPPQCIRTTYNGQGKSSSNSGEEPAGQKQLLPFLGWAPPSLQWWRVFSPPHLPCTKWEAAPLRPIWPYASG